MNDNIMIFVNKIRL